MNLAVIDAGEIDRVIGEKRGNVKGNGKGKKAANTTTGNTGKIFTTDEVDCSLGLVDKYKEGFCLVT